MSEQQQPAAAEPSFREQVEIAESVDTNVSSTVDRETVPDPRQPEPAQEAETPEQPKYVPLGALHEERQKRKNAEALARQREQEFNQWQQTAQQRLDQLHQLAMRQQEPQRQVPSFDEDPLSNIGATVQDVKQQMEDLRQQQMQERQAAHQQQVVSRFVADVDTHERQFAERVAPDYFEAVNWAKAKKASEYVAVGFTEEAAWQRVQGEAGQLAIDALSRGESPAEVGYRLAQAIGYTPQRGNAQRKLEMQKQGRAASTPSGGSGQGGGRLSLDALAKMSGDDFLKATSGDNWKKMMGGR